ncbi:MAG: carboxypeptidase-like regulatory domain-containing protein [Chitinophagaceae bacterium]|nr:carboxypeptidase-like regulatory domain-containing protein [Chitinophagaceae bacterium]
MKEKSSFSVRCLGIMLTVALFLAASTGPRAQDLAALTPSLGNSEPVTETDLKTASLQEFMHDFKQTYQNIYYSYESNSLRSVRVNYDALDASGQSNPDQVLSRVLSTAGLVFEKIKDVYVIRQDVPKREEQHFAVPAAVITSAAVDFTVSGRVSDENGAVAGATVTERGTNNATTTDNYGNYTL